MSADTCPDELQAKDGTDHQGQGIEGEEVAELLLLQAKIIDVDGRGTGNVTIHWEKGGRHYQDHYYIS